MEKIKVQRGSVQGNKKIMWCIAVCDPFANVTLERLKGRPAEGADPSVEE